MRVRCPGADRSEDRLPRVLLHAVPVERYDRLMDNDNDEFRLGVHASYFQWHRLPNSLELGDVIVSDTPSVYHETIRERVVDNVREAEILAGVPQTMRLTSFGHRRTRSAVHSGETNGSWRPNFSQRDILTLAQKGARRPMHTLVCEVGACLALSAIQAKIDNLYSPQQELPRLVLFIDVKPFVNGQPQNLQTVLHRIPDLYLKAYLFTRSGGFSGGPDQEIAFGDCDEDGHLYHQKMDPSTAVIRLPIQDLYSHAAHRLPIQVQATGEILLNLENMYTSLVDSLRKEYMMDAAAAAARAARC